MPFESGRPKTGGRTPGTANKRTQELIDLAESLGVNPFEILLRYASGDHKSLGLPEHDVRITKDGNPVEIRTITPELRMAAASKACDFLFPKLKSIEHTGKDGESLDARVLGPKELAAALARNPFLRDVPQTETESEKESDDGKAESGT